MRFVYDLSSIHLTTWLQAGYRTFIEVVGLGLLSKMVPQWLIPLNQEYHVFQQNLRQAQAFHFNDGKSLYEEKICNKNLFKWRSKEFTLF